MLDASEGVTEQDASVLGAVLDAGRALVVAVNKWDGLSDYQRSQVEALLSRKLAFVPWAEAVRISAMHGSGLRELFRAIHRAPDSAPRKFSTAAAPRALAIASEPNPPPVVSRHVAQLRYAPPGAEHPTHHLLHGPPPQ